MPNWRLRICQGVNCKNYLSDDLFKYAEKLAQGKSDLTVEQRSCMDKCACAPNMQIINDTTGEIRFVTNIDYKIIEDTIKELSA
jgi:NADH:ubiquinone oxidoreductase subunit E